MLGNLGNIWGDQERWDRGGDDENMRGRWSGVIPPRGFALSRFTVVKCPRAKALNPTGSWGFTLWLKA